MRRTGKTTLLPILILILGYFVASAAEKEIIKDKSPDGKFALRAWKGEEGWGAAIVDVRTKKSVVDLDVYGNYVEGMGVVWSKDSKRVAQFEPDRRGGTTHIYFRNSSKFEEVQFPHEQLPDCNENPNAEGGEKYLKTTEATTSPKQWLKSGALVVVIDESWLTESGNEHHCSETVTITFDANHKASVQKVTDKKVD